MLFHKSVGFILGAQLCVIEAKNFKVYVGLNSTLTFSPSTLRAGFGDTVEFLFAAHNHTVTSSRSSIGCQPNGLVNSGFVPASAAVAPPPAPVASSLVASSPVASSPVASSAAASSAAALPPAASSPAASPAVPTTAAASQPQSSQPADAFNPLDPFGIFDDLGILRGRSNPLSPNKKRAASTKLPSFTITMLDNEPLTLYCAQDLHCQNGMVMVINPAASGAGSLANYKKLAAAAPENVAPAGIEGGVLRHATGATAGAQVIRVTPS